jgi:hypothetical protein
LRRREQGTKTGEEGGKEEEEEAEEVVEVNVQVPS